MTIGTRSVRGFSILGACVLACVQTAQACTIPSSVSASAYVLYKNLKYTSPGSRQQELDVFTPAGVSGAPVVLIIHGGSFVYGVKEAPEDVAKVLATFGIASASLNYRLATDASKVFPAQMQDVRCAVRWLKANGAKFGYDGSRVGTLGESAGGNMAGLLGTTVSVGRYFDEASCVVDASVSPSVLAVADYYGLNTMTDAAALNDIQTRSATSYLGVPPLSDPKLAAKASPIDRVTAASTPFFVARGTNDTEMPELQATELVAALNNVGVPVQYWDIQGPGHAFSPVDVTKYPQLQDSACAMIGFFQSAFGM